MILTIALGNRTMSFSGPQPVAYDDEPGISRPAPASAEGVSAALSALSPEYRQIMVLRECRGLGYDQIARLLGVSRLTISQKLAAARSQMVGQMSAVESLR